MREASAELANEILDDQGYLEEVIRMPCRMLDLGVEMLQYRFERDQNWIFEYSRRTK